MKKILIAAPFGVYIKTDWVQSVRGTYTIDPRPGVIKQALKTFRPIRGGWVNQMGFRNKGIESELPRIITANNSTDSENVPIWNIGAVQSITEWWDLYNTLECTPNIILELNRGCPNVPGSYIPPYLLSMFVRTFNNIIVKVPGHQQNAMDIFDECYKAGVKTFHFCNTIPTNRGGESSRRIQEISLKCIEQVKKEHSSNVTCIGGGGLYTATDVQKYKDVGTDHFSLGTIFLTPWKIKEVVSAINS